MANDATIVSQVGQCAGGYGLSTMTLTGTPANGPKNGLRATGPGSPIDAPQRLMAQLSGCAVWRSVYLSSDLNSLTYQAL